MSIENATTIEAATVSNSNNRFVGETLAERNVPWAGHDASKAKAAHDDAIASPVGKWDVTGSVERLEAEKAASAEYNETVSSDEYWLFVWNEVADWFDGFDDDSRANRKSYAATVHAACKSIL